MVMIFVLKIRSANRYFHCRFDPPLRVNPGDEIRTTCTYYFLSSNETIFFGEGTSDEMCYGFITYYPAQNIALPYCTTWKTVEKCKRYMPQFGGIIDGCKWKDFLSGGNEYIGFMMIELAMHCNTTCSLNCTEKVRNLREHECLRGDIGDFMIFKLQRKYPSISLIKDCFQENKSDNLKAYSYCLILSLAIMYFS
ncbi:DBH [Mytilus edulis]|uniref:DBH n=1 Tax=Mytilus edulis TaxID=6550 RepID=A0A8S3UIK5_MYTED|nr:DBH [Mytilus edulis]